MPVIEINTIQGAEAFAEEHGWPLAIAAVFTRPGRTVFTLGSIIFGPMDLESSVQQALELSPVGRALLRTADEVVLFDILAGLQNKLVNLTAQQENIMALVQVDTTQITAVVDAIATLKTDTAKSLADIAAKLQNSVATADPATAVVLTQAIADLGQLDSSINAADPGAALVPAGGTTAP